MLTKYPLRDAEVHKLKKSFKKTMTIISIPHAHLPTMNKTCAMFQKDQTKIVAGVVLTKYPLIASEMPKMTKKSKNII